MEPINSLEEFRKLLEENEAVLAYFSTENCSVCKVLKPKVAQLIAEFFPKIKSVYIQSDHLPELVAQHRIFTVPTITIYFDGRETIRKSRAFGVQELKDKIERPYGLLFE